jgi:hypothetical protein
MMAMKVTYIAKNGEFTVDYSGNNGAVMTSATVTGRDVFGPNTRHWGALLNVMPGERINVRRTQLLTEAEELVNILEKDLELLQIDYSFADAHSPRFRCGSGWMIRGELYGFEAGMGTCRIVRRELGASGKHYTGQIVDLRLRGAIDTDNQGQIKIRKRKKPITLHVQLRGLIGFLQVQSDEFITNVMDGGKVRLADIIGAYKEGIQYDWGREQLLAMGEEGKNELLERLKDRKSRTNKLVLAEMLADCFPSPEVTRAIDWVLGGETDPANRQFYSDLLRRMSKE